MAVLLKWKWCYWSILILDPQFSLIAFSFYQQGASTDIILFSCNQGNLFIMKHYFPLCFITNCNLLNKPKWRWYCSTANIPHTVLSTTAGGDCAGKQQPPANKDTLTIQTLKECLYTWNLNIYIYRKKKI